MTIQTHNWCPTCQVGVHDHNVICTVCGEMLGPPPEASSRQRNANSASSFAVGQGVRAIPEFVTEDFRLVGREMRTMLSSLSGTVPGVYNDGGDGDWQTIPAELMVQESHVRRPTAKKALAAIPRIVLDDKSALFRQALLELFSSSSSRASSVANFTCVPAEFGPTEVSEIEGILIVASPRTAKGGLSDGTKRSIQQSSTAIVYIERGDGITFVNKAIQAQQAGARAVVIGNNMSSPWPYIMKDSVGEAEELGLTIPVVMIKHEDTKALLELYETCKNSSTTSQEVVCARFKIQSLGKDCAVCCDVFGVTEIIMCLPLCGHVFHEKCVLAWLSAHNTCPFCRRELPTDDVDYERERRRAQRTHGGSNSAGGGSEAQWSGYYG